MLAVFTVKLLGDVSDAGDSLLTLREAIVAANASSGADTIEFDPGLTAGVPASVVLTQGELIVTDALTIIGPGANLLTVDASGSDLTPATKNGDGSRVFNIGDGNTGTFFDVSISGLTITGADAKTHLGGGIFSNENLTLQNCVISGNSVTPDTSIGPSSDGGAVSERYASLTITNCVITGNRASSQGGGVSFDVYPNRPGVLTIADSTFANNIGPRGGGLYWSGIGSITDSTFSDNSAGTGIGGAILCELHSGSFNVGQKLITGTTVERNSAMNGGGVYFNFEGSQTSNGTLPSLKLVDCDLNHNTATSTGGGLGTNSTTGTTGAIKVEADGTSFTYNTAGIGGGAYLSQVFGGIEGVVDGCTFAHNNGGTTGGGLYAALPTFTLSDSDFSNNTVTSEGGGAYVSNGSSVGGTSFSIDGCDFTENSAPAAAGLSLHLSSGTTRTVSNLTATNNLGDGIFFVGGTTLNINSSTVTGNQKAGITGSGAALNINGSTVKNNLAGGVRSSNSDIGITNCIIAGNTGSPNGGGVQTATNKAINVSNSTISSNTTAGSGGGLYGGTITVTSSSITDNTSTSSGGGINAAGALTLTASLVARNTSTQSFGGGATSTSAAVSRSAIFDNKASSGGGLNTGACSITDSSVTNNTATGTGGGGINAQGNVTLQQSTISGNHASLPSAKGGGIVTTASLFAYNSTVTNNVAGSKGGGIYAGASTIKDTIIAGNSAASSNPDLRFTGTPTLNYSIVGDKAGTTLTESQTPNANGSRIGSSTGGGVIDPQLGPLAYYGGQLFADGTAMLSQPPLPASPTLNAGNPSAGIAPTARDQRGGGWLRKVGGRIDIGSIEAQPNLLPGDYDFNGVVDAADYVLWRKLSGSVTDLRADGSGNGLVDQDDYDFWRARIGNTLAPGAGAANEVAEGIALQSTSVRGVSAVETVTPAVATRAPILFDRVSSANQLGPRDLHVLSQETTGAGTAPALVSERLVSAWLQIRSHVNARRDSEAQSPADSVATRHVDCETFDDVDQAFDHLATDVV